MGSQYEHGARLDEKGLVLRVQSGILRCLEHVVEGRVRQRQNHDFTVDPQGSRWIKQQFAVPRVDEQVPEAGHSWLLDLDRIPVYEVEPRGKIEFGTSQRVEKGGLDTRINPFDVEDVLSARTQAQNRCDEERHCGKRSRSRQKKSVHGDGQEMIQGCLKVPRLCK